MFFLIEEIGVLVGRDYINTASVDNINAIHKLQQNSKKVIGFGSSHMWSSFDSPLLYELYGIDSYNYANNWQRMDTTLLFIKDALKSQNPDAIVIETYMVGLSNKIPEVNGEVYYTRVLPNNKDKLDYLKNRFGKRLDCYLGYYVPLCAFHDNWVNIELFNAKKQGSNEFIKTMGWSKVDTVNKVSIPDYRGVAQREFDQETLDILDEIIEICNAGDIDVIFITTPMEEKFHYSDAMEEYARDNGCYYLNFFELADEIGIDDNNDFYDSAHLNVYGAEKVTEYLGDFLMTNCNLGEK